MTLEHDSDPLMQATRERMDSVFTPNQVLGRSRVIGCTAVEITQRCNLDCSLCYLSENSEAVVDPPFDEIINRLNAVRASYGPGTNVQITGGDPTLRKHHELIAFVRHAREIGLYPALFTNGIAASGKLLRSLAEAGLTEVAFHVDTTQKRPGYDTELDLNAIRKEYIEKARGLGLMTIFNTTVHAGNFHEIPSLVEFFAEQNGEVGFASFQLQAETGRGEWSKRAAVVSLETVRRQIDAGVGRRLPWDIVRVGHPQCHSYAPALVVNGRVFPVVDDETLFVDFLRDFCHLRGDRRAEKTVLLRKFAAATARKPSWLWRGVKFAAKHVWRAKRDLFAARGRVRKLSFFVQNFMDAADLDQERIDACSFMVMTAEGPVSMCEHNSRRDEFILKPITFFKRDGSTGEYIPIPEQSMQNRLRGNASQ